MKKTLTKKHFNFVRIASFWGIVIVLILITIGYSAATVNLTAVNPQAFYRVYKIIRISDLTLNNVTNNATATNITFNSYEILSDISLPSSNSTVTFNVDITNLGNEEMSIVDITGVPNNLTYTLGNYTMEATLCDHIDPTQCTLGSTSRIQITFAYDTNGYDGINTDFSLDITLTFDTIDYVARIGTQKYTTLQAAMDAAPTDGTPTTVVLLKNVVERVAVHARRNIIFDFPGLALTNNESAPVIEILNTGKNEQGQSITGPSRLTMTNGTIVTTSKQAGVNAENGGTFIMTGGTIQAIGTSQAVYVNNGGTATISGSAYLSASALVDQNANRYRGTAEAVAGGTLTITGGTIIANGTNGIAVASAGTTTIGTKDGNVNISNPNLKGVDYGIYIAGGTFNFYDGIAKGKVAAINNESAISDIETNHAILHNTETISGDTYYTATLSSGQLVRVTFDADGGQSSEGYRDVLQGTAIGNLPTATKTNSIFLGWFDSNNREIGPSEIINNAVTYTAHWTSSSNLARIGNTYYPTVQDAVNAVPTNNTKTTIQVIADITGENVVVSNGQYVEFDLQNHTMSTTTGSVINNSGRVDIISGTYSRTTTNDETRTIINQSSGVLNISGGTIQSSVHQAIRNYGTATITGGTVTITAGVDQGVINNESGGNLTISGGQITGTKRQAVYNSGGTVTISGNAYLASDVSATSKVRGVLENASGTANITGGTIITTSSRCPAVINNGTMTIGTNDNSINGSSPVIQSNYYGLQINSSKTVAYYDGIIRGSTTNGAINAESRVVTDTQHSVTIHHRSESIDGVTFDTAYLSQ